MTITLKTGILLSSMLTFTFATLHTKLHTPHTHTGASKLEPTERMAIQGNTIEENINTFVLNVLAPVGLETLVRLSTPTR